MEGSTSANGASTQAVFRSVPAGQQVAEVWPYLRRSQQEEDGVKIAFFRHYAFSRRKLARIVAGTPNASYSRYVHQYLGLSATVCKDRQSMILCIAFKRMPVFPWYKLEEGRSTAICAVSYDCQGLPSTSQVRTDEYADSYRGSVCGH